MFGKIYRAYYDTAYGVTKAAFQPVVAAISDTISENFSSVVEETVDEAIGPLSGVVEFLFGKK